MDALYVVALLACPVGMGLCMWLMMRGRPSRGGGERSPARNTAQDTEIQRLRAEVDELRQAQRGRENSRVERG